ncbi:hypothetical protein [Porphyrobacter sp. HT-58-2]|uniref:hypothetical protein n=1 Tax=Porphyrobacter sp. HT-58-2 TaxID=2023229 RepID=UPI001F32EBAA|nr:hypothetical protein [Porphyrobacter sp. HT-58-2]
MIRAVAALLAVGLLLGGCAGGGKPSPARGSGGIPPRSTIVVVPQVMAAQGLEGVIGSSASGLTRRLGVPRIDLVEGDARKLQFAGAACVLDIFLYPPGAGAEPTAAHVEARLRQGGAPVDAGACIREIEGR